MNKITGRIRRMEEILEERKTLPVKTMAELLDVSEMTVRRDLSSAKENTSIRNIRGMLIFEPSGGTRYSVSDAMDANSSEKIRIGEAAASMVKENDVIMLDIGSTTECAARALRQDLKATVICTGYNALTHLTQKKSLKIFCTGGEYHLDTQLLESSESIEFLKRIRATRLFASAAGIHKQLGVTCVNSYEAPVKQALIASSAERILLVDSSKFGCVQSSCFADITCYQKVITDVGIPPEWEEYLVEKGVEVIKV